MTRSTAQVMEWRDAIQVARLEAYCTGYYEARELHRRHTRTCGDYDDGYEAGLRFLAAASATHSETPLATSPR